MANRYQPEYRRKKRAVPQRDSPFPVPIASLTNIPCDENFWYQFTGHLQNDSVHIRSSGDVKYLYKMGFFGRGMLSRGAADFHQSTTYVYLPGEAGSEPNIVNIMKRRMYLRHSHWQKLADSSSPEDCNVDNNNKEFDSDVDCGIEPEHDINLEAVKDSYQQDPVINETEPSAFQTDKTKDTLSEPNLESWDTNEGDPDFWNNDGAHLGDTKTDRLTDDCPSVSHNAAESAADDWENCEADEDFWGSSTPVVNGNTDINRIEHSDLDLVCKGEGHCKGNDQPPVKKRRLNEESNLFIEGRHVESIKSEVPSSADDNSSSLIGLKKCLGDSNIGCQTVRTLNTLNCSSHNDFESSSETTVIQSLTCDIKSIRSNEEGSKTNICDKALDENGKRAEKLNTLDTIEASKTETSEASNTAGNEENICNNSDTNNGAGWETIKTGEKEKQLQEKEMKNEGIKGNDQNVKDGSQIDEKEFHPYCRLDEKDGDFLVVDDSDADDHVKFGPKKNGFLWKPTMKKDPYSYTEPLILTAEEAFFLSYGLGCLSVIEDESEEPLTLKELWCKFCLRPSFLPCYAAYHYFRSRGWVPKAGVVFGTDFVLYREGPPFFHASYSVIVKTVHSGSYKTVEKFSKRSFTWAAFSGLQRVTEHVAKTLLVCYVVIPPDLTDEETTSPTCLSKIKIILQRYNRWVSSQEREQDKPADIP